MNDFKNLKKTNAAIEKAELRKHRLKNLDRIDLFEKAPCLKSILNVSI